jgi:hypothetical protein
MGKLRLRAPPRSIGAPSHGMFRAYGGMAKSAFAAFPCSRVTVFLLRSGSGRSIL